MFVSSAWTKRLALVMNAQLRSTTTTFAWTFPPAKDLGRFTHVNGVDYDDTLTWAQVLQMQHDSAQVEQKLTE